MLDFPYHHACGAVLLGVTCSLFFFVIETDSGRGGVLPVRTRRCHVVVCRSDALIIDHNATTLDLQAPMACLPLDMNRFLVITSETRSFVVVFNGLTGQSTLSSYYLQKSD